MTNTQPRIIDAAAAKARVVHMNSDNPVKGSVLPDPGTEEDVEGREVVVDPAGLVVVVVAREDVVVVSDNVVDVSSIPVVVVVS
jgi:hypothetical protein